MSTNVFLTDLDLAAFNVLDGRRLEVVADGLTLFRGAQLAIDTTMVSPLHRDGSARRRAAAVDGAALEAARRRKERTYPELAGDGGRGRLVVLAAEVGGRWSTQTAQFLSALAKARALSVPQVLQGRVVDPPVERHPRLQCGPGIFLVLVGPAPGSTGAKFPQHTKCCGMTGSRRDGSPVLQVVLLRSVASGRALTAVSGGSFPAFVVFKKISVTV